MHDRGISRSLTAVVLVAAVMMLAAGTAQAATVTVGSPLTGTLVNRIGAIPTTQVNSLVPSPGLAASPVDGTVISWKFVGGGPVPLRVVRPIGGGLYLGVGTSAPQAGPGFGLLSGDLPANIPVKQGDLFGIDIAVNSTFSTYNSGPLGQRLEFLPPLADGGNGRPNDDAFAEHLGLQSTVRYCAVPKVKGKGLKKAKKALRAADCTIGKVRKSKKTASRKKVVKQSSKPGSSISDTEPVNLKVSRTD